MITTFQSPVAGITGKLQYNGKFYIRRLYGKYVLQRCPNRKGHVPTERERENQQRFIQQYRRVRVRDVACGEVKHASVDDGCKAAVSSAEPM